MDLSLLPGIVVHGLLFLVIPIIAFVCIGRDLNEKDRKRRAENRKKAKVQKWCEKLTGVTDESKYPNDVELLVDMGKCYVWMSEPANRLICARKAYALGRAESAADVANLLLEHGDGTVSTLKEAEHFASMHDKGQKILGAIRRKLALKLGLEACEKKQWEEALSHLRDALPIGYRKSILDLEEYACGFYYAAMAQMECAKTYLDWEIAYLWASEPGLEETSYAAKLKEMEGQILSRGAKFLSHVLELLSNAAQDEAQHDYHSALFRYMLAESYGSCIAVCRVGLLRARFAMSLSEYDDAMKFVQRALDMGYPRKAEVLDFMERRRYSIDKLDSVLQGRLERALRELRERALNNRDGLCAVEYARLASVAAVRFSELETIASDLRCILKKDCTERDAVQQWIDAMQMKIGMAMVHKTSGNMFRQISAINHICSRFWHLDPGKAPYASYEWFVNVSKKLHGSMQTLVSMKAETDPENEWVFDELLKTQVDKDMAKKAEVLLAANNAIETVCKRRFGN